ncbi:MAG: Creatininase [Hyphomicrobiales bacterium]|nr:Creatininase [Hyphomicrobiales bacterium]
MAQTHQWTELTWADFHSRDMERTIAVLPVAAVEQHGPHLPVGVDTFIMQGYLARAVARLPPDSPVLFLPVQAVGKSDEHIAFPGTLTLSAETAARSWIEIGESVARTGCRKIVILNSHGGNVAIMDQVARELRRRCGMLAVVCSWSRFGYPDGLFSAHERTHGIHGGDIETSLMRAFRPDTVREDELADFPPASIEMESDFTWLRAHHPIGFGWLSQDLSVSGAMGNALDASAEKGRACADYGATAFLELLQDVEAFDLDRLVEGPLD